MWELVANPKDKLSYDVAQLILYIPLIFIPQGAVVFYQGASWKTKFGDIAKLDQTFL